MGGAVADGRMVKLSKPQRKVLGYLARCGHASERQIASAAFGTEKRANGTYKLGATPSVMRALYSRGLVYIRVPGRQFGSRHVWGITDAGREAVSDG